MPDPTAPRPDVPDELVSLAADAHEQWQVENRTSDDYEIYRCSHEAWMRATLAAVLPEIERRAVEAERAAIVRNTRHYFAASDTDGPDGLWDDVEILCSRIERGEYGARKEDR